MRLRSIMLLDTQQPLPSPEPTPDPAPHHQMPHIPGVPEPVPMGGDEEMPALQSLR